VKRLAVLAMLVGCASFEDPTIVLDLRVLAIETTPPEQVLDVDPARPPTIDELLLQLQPIRVRALVSEPNFTAELTWTMTACLLEEQGGRCDPEQPSFEFAGGVLQDPEALPFGAPCKDQVAEIGNTICGLLVPDNRLVQMLFAALETDPTGGLGGIDVGIVLRVRDNYIMPPAESFAEKRVRFVPRIPVDRRANNNPNIDELLLGRGGFGAQFQKSHCMDLGQVNQVNPGETVTLFPVSRESDKEEYVLPTLDGGSERFKEFLTYQWIATHGSFVDEVTGGPPDVFGNVKLDGTEWKAPAVEQETFVTVWVIQRDARLGVRWRQGCLKVEP
jgi:hypothetical protein